MQAECDTRGPVGVAQAALQAATLKSWLLQAPIGVLCFTKNRREASVDQFAVRSARV
jgi:hypothetical protein